MSAAALATTSAMLSCGSRTGLFGPDPDEQIFDASADALDESQIADATRDRADALPDATPCIPGQFGFQLALAQLMFVLDRSGSMAFAIDHDVEPPVGLPTRWTTMHDSLQQAIAPFDQQIQMGAKFFPGVNADAFDPVGACVLDPGVDIPPGLGNVGSILNVFNITSPVGGTPTAAGIQAAASFLSGTRGVARAMVLATDGEPNCNGALNAQTCTCTSRDPNACKTNPQGSYDCLDDIGTVNLISNVFQTQKIPVYVIGIGPSVAGPTLEAMAIAGGRPRAGEPKYYAGDTAADLSSAFDVVRDSIAKCTYLTPSSPQDPNSITVTVGGAPIGRDTTHTDGWDWVDQTFGELQLFGAACDKATASNVSGTIACKDQ